STAPGRACGHGQGHAKTALGGRRAPRLLPFPGATAPPTPPLAAGLSAAPQATFSAPGPTFPKSRPFSRLGVALPWAPPRTNRLHGRRPPKRRALCHARLALL